MAELLWSVPAGPGLAFLPELSSRLAALSPPVEARVSLSGAAGLRLTPCKPLTVRMETWRRPSPGPRARLRRRRKVRGAGTRQPRPSGRHTGAFQRVRTPPGQALKKKIESVLPAVEPRTQGGSPESAISDPRLYGP